MENLTFTFPSSGKTLERTVHVGVVASGDLEVLLEVANGNQTVFHVKTASDGKKTLWEALLGRICEVQPFPTCQVFINDFAASPGVVQIRLEQALAHSGPQKEK